MFGHARLPRRRRNAPSSTVLMVGYACSWTYEHPRHLICVRRNTDVFDFGGLTLAGALEILKMSVRGIFDALAKRGKPKGLSRFYIVASSRRRRLMRRMSSGCGSTSEPRSASASWISFTWTGWRLSSCSRRPLSIQYRG
jgi:hypothetical protein